MFVSKAGAYQSGAPYSTTYFSGVQCCKTSVFIPVIAAKKLERFSHKNLFFRYFSEQEGRSLPEWSNVQ